MEKNDARLGAYSYGRTKSGGVFALAGLAAGGALLLVWGAWSTLEAATLNNRIAEPPDLKKVVEKIEVGSSDLTYRTGKAHRADARRTSGE